MNFGSTLVHNASVDLINLLCGTSVWRRGTQGIAVNVPCRQHLSPCIRTYPRRITIADPVPGIAQPRLADTSAFFTWRQPPSR